MNFVLFLILITINFIFGISLVKYLTINPLKMNKFLGISSLLLFIILIGIFIQLSNDLISTSIILLFNAIFFLLGYTYETKRFLSLELEEELPIITEGKKNQSENFTTVIYLTHGESENYNPASWIRQINEFDEQNVPFVPFLIRPIFFYHLRKKYLKVGKSEHRRMHQKIIQNLEDAFRKSGKTNLKFYLAFLDDIPRPDTALINALNDGAKKIIVSFVFVSISSHTVEGTNLINKINVEEEFGVPVKFTRPLWDSPTLHRMFLEKIDEDLENEDKSKIGILLVGHGQPSEWDVLFPTQTQHETAFREKIRTLLVAHGYLEDNISFAWMEFKDPKPSEKIKEFVRKGIQRIYYFAASISADSIHSQYDIPELIKQAKVHKNVKLINMGAWNNHPLVIKAIKERIEEQLEI